MDGHKIAWIILTVVALITLAKLAETSTRDLGRTAGIRVLLGMILVGMALSGVGGVWLGWTGVTIAVGGVLVEFLNSRDARLCGSGMALANAGNPEAGLEVIDKAILLNPDDPHFHYCRGVVLGRMDRGDEAVAALQTAINKEPRRGEYHLALGRIFLQQRRYELALEQLSEAIRTIPTEVECYLSRVDVWIHLGRYREALGDMTAALNLLPNEEHFYLRGQLFAQIGEHELAERDFNEAIRRTGHARYYAARAKTRMELGNTAGATSDIKKAGKKGLSAGEWAALNARAHMLAGDADEAVAEYQRAIEDNPDDPEGYIALAEFLLTTESRHRNPGQALALAQRAETLSSEPDWRLLDLIARAALAHNNRSLAQAYTLRAMEKAPQHALPGLQQRLAQLEKAEV